MITKAIVTSMDNLPLLRVSIPILLRDPHISQVIVVNQDSKDGTAEWLETQPVIAINKENNGAGPGRNRGLDAAGDFDYVLMLDGGMRPLLPDCGIMIDFLERRKDIDVLGLAWHDLETDINLAWRRWPYTKILDDMVYPYRMVSLTNYCLCNKRAWDGFRFTEEGPFSEPGWGADDDEMAYQWREGGITVFAIQGAKAYRRGSGSFRRLFRETGVWPNQYGSVYEKRVVFLMQNWPQMGAITQWGEPWLTVVIRNSGDIEEMASLIKGAHRNCKRWHLDGNWTHIPQPYSIILWIPEPDEMIERWAEPRRLRQDHGDTIIIDGEIIRRGPETENLWAGDFRIYRGRDPQDAIRENAHYWAVVSNQDDLDKLFTYWRRFPQESPNRAPDVKREVVNYGSVN